MTSCKGSPQCVRSRVPFLGHCGFNSRIRALGYPQTGYSGPSPARGPACPAPLLRSLTPSFSLTSANTAASNARRSESEPVKVFKCRWSVHKRKSGAQSATSSKLEHQLPARQSWGYAKASTRRYVADDVVRGCVEEGVSRQQHERAGSTDVDAEQLTIVLCLPGGSY